MLERNKSQSAFVSGILCESVQDMTYVDTAHLLHKLNTKGQIEALVGLDTSVAEEIHPGTFFLGLDSDGLDDVVCLLANL